MGTQSKMELKINQHYLTQVLSLYQQKLSGFRMSDDLRNMYIDELDVTVDHLAYYVICSPSVLNRIVDKAVKLQDEDYISATLEVFNYLVYPNDVIPDNKRGLYGYLDDAWLIHNFVRYSIHAKYIDKEELDLEWHIINQINKNLENAVSSDSFTLLNQRLGRILKSI